MKLAKTFLAIGISVIFTVFIAYGLYAVYEPPKYETNTSTCTEGQDCYTKFIKGCEQKQECGKTGPCSVAPLGENCYEKAEKNPEYQKCRQNFDQCEKDYKKTTEKYRHARNSFYALLVIGILAMTVGAFLTKLEGIGSGFIGGGVLVVLWSLPYTWEYWFELHKYTKVAALGVVLVILVYLGYKKLEKRK